MLPVRNMKIRNKLIAIVMLTCMLSLVLVGGAFVFWEWQGLRNNLVQKLLTEAQITCRQGSACFAESFSSGSAGKSKTSRASAEAKW